MAYKNLLAQSCTDNKEAFKRMRDFLCKRNGSYDYSVTGIGWTLIDSSYAVSQDTITVGDWFVIYSQGESEKEDLYYRFNYQTTRCAIQGYRFWNATAHSGLTPYPAASTLGLVTVASTANTLWVYGDLDGALVVNKYSTSYNATCFGSAQDAVYDRTVATSAGALSAGANRTITLDAAPGSWAVGRRLFIRDNANLERITIKTLVGNVITADLVSSYAANSRLRAGLCYYVSGDSTWSTTGSFYSLVRGDGTQAAAASSGSNPYSVGSSTTGSSDLMNDGYPIAPVRLLAAGEYLLGSLTNIQYIDTNGRIEQEVFSDPGGVFSWRYFSLTQAGVYIVVKEV